MILAKRHLLKATFFVFIFTSLGFFAPLKAQEITGLSGFSIFIDQGHSATENQGVFGYSEAEKSLAIGLELQRLLMERTDIDTAYVARTNGTQVVELSQRTSLANALNADFYYSIHSDAGGATATSTLMLHGGWKENGVIMEKNPKGGKAMGDIMDIVLTDAMVRSTGGVGRRGNYADRTFYRDANQSYRYPYLHVNRESRMASLLSEAGFHTNAYQNQRNMNADYKRLEARAAFWSILEYMGVSRPVEGILTGEIKDFDTELFVNGATITVQGKSVTTDTYDSVFNKYSNNPNHLRNGFFYIDGLTPGPAEVIISGDHYDADTLQVVIGDTVMTYLYPVIRNNLLPSVESTSPGEGGSLNPGGQLLTINFNKNMNEASVESALSISPAANFNFNWITSKRLGITTSDLDYETDYTLTIGEGPTESSARALEFDGNVDGTPGGVFTLNFTTGPADILPPKVTAIDPFKTTTLTNSVIVSITLDELIDHATVTDSSVHLTASGLDDVAGTVKVYDVFDRSVITFFPNTTLEYDTKYTTVISPGYSDISGNTVTAERRGLFTTGNTQHDNVIDIHDFESGYAPFWQPTQSGSTTGYISENTSVEATSSITNLLSGSTKAMRINYGFMTDQSGLIRVHNPSTGPKFNSSYILQSYVFGDGNGNHFRFVVRDNKGELEAGPWTTVDWIGWKLVTWDMTEDDVVAFTGDGVINGLAHIDSYQIAYTSGQPNIGYMVFDDLKAVTLQTATSIEEEAASNLPTAISLNQNYPNPFNPSTNIRFELPARSEVRLEVFDMLGRKVETIFSGPKAAGAHLISFDASGLASGVYIYRLTTGNHVLSKKMLLMK